MSAQESPEAELIVAVDAGGSKTAACVARKSSPFTFEVLGRGRNTGANPLTIGVDRAVEAIASTIDAARQDARLPTAAFDRALLSIAGAANPAVGEQLIVKLRQLDIAGRIAVVSDVLPILAAGADNGIGMGVIAGTGSVAFGRNERGLFVRHGGWGYLLGDEGSGYGVGRAALRSVLEDLESPLGVPGRLGKAILDELQVADAADLKQAIYSSPNPRHLIASFAKHVARFANERDTCSIRILDSAAISLTMLIDSTARHLGFRQCQIPLALAGGLLVGCEYLRTSLIQHLEQMKIDCRLTLVADPLEGCLKLAALEPGGDLVQWT